MSEIALNKIDKIFSYNKVLDGVSFDINRGERVGLIGRNGTGKTTIFKIITGREFPSGDIGDVIIRKGANVCSLDQIPDYSDEVQVKDILHEAFKELLAKEKELRAKEQQLAKLKEEELQIQLEVYKSMQDYFESHGGYEIDEKIRWVSAGLNIPDNHFNRCFNTLSGGEKTRIILASLLLKEPDVLLLDEPTNHLDMKSVEWLEEFLKRYVGAALIISHDRYFLDRVVNKILVLRNGKITKFNSNYSNYALEMKNREKSQWNEYDLIKKEIRKVEADLKKSIARNAKNHSAFMSAKIRDLSEELKELKKIPKPMSDKQITLNFKTTFKTSKIVLRMNNVHKSFGDNIVLKGVNLQINKHEKVALIGENGSGKSTLIKLMMHSLMENQFITDFGLKPDRGEVYVGNGIKAGYLDQELEFPDQDTNVLQHLMINHDLDEGKARTELARFLFYEEDIDKKISILSGGEKTRLKLCGLMQTEINTLILDEPTNHLDIDSRELLEEIIKAFPGNVIYISHDRYFINQTAARIMHLENGKVTVFNGNYDKYKDFLSDKDKPVIQNREQERNFKMEKKLKNRIQKLARQKDTIENEIEELESKKKELDDAMLQHPLDYQILCEIQEEKDNVQSKIDILFEKWQELEEQNWSI